MLLKFKKSNLSFNYITNNTILSSYNRGSFEKLNPNNKKRYSYLESISNCKVKNAYNLFDENGETIGIVFCKLLDSNNFGGIKISFIPLGQDGYYDKNNVIDLFDGSFEYKESYINNTDKSHWKISVNESIKHLSSIFSFDNYLNKDGSSYKILNNITGKQAAHKIIFKLADLCKSIYEKDLFINKAYNKNLL